ncbi:hypothetical protein [Achromobacter sp. NCFB-sbj8-Ac1-l]|uniref:hypothetical protein n=1 Tax=unclassified Achromobacter TaxID=2626865 RepID=UPI00404698EA
MAYSFVCFKNKEFRVNDLDFAVTCFVLIKQADASALEEFGLMFDQWLDSIAFSGGGCLDLLLDKYLTTCEKIKRFSELLDLARYDVSSYGEFYPGELLCQDLSKVQIALAGNYRVSHISKTLCELQRIVGC